MISRHFSAYYQWEVSDYVVGKDMGLPSQHEPVEAWLRRASQVGRAQGRNLSSESMTVNRSISISGCVRILDVLKRCRTMSEGVGWAEVGRRIQSDTKVVRALTT